MLSTSMLPLVAVTQQVLDPKLVESLTLFKIPPVVSFPLASIVLSVAIGYLLAKWLRLKDYGWKFSLILAAWAVSITLIVFGQFKLGVDLSGGANLVYEVDEKQTALLNPTGSYDLNAVIAILRRRLNPSGVKELVIRKSGPKQIEVVVPEVDKGQIEEIKRLIKTGGALRFLIVANNASRDGHIIEAAKALERDEERRREQEVKDEDGNTIGIWMKVGREDPDDRESAFRHAPVYRDIIRDPVTGEIITLSPSEEAELNQDATRLSQVLAKRGIREIDVLLRAPDSPELDVRGEDLAGARPELEMGGWQIGFTMKGTGIGKMSALTGQNLPTPERSLAIVFDNVLVSAPVIQGHISERGQITGRFTEKEVILMSELLKSGSMPVVFLPEPIAENLIGSILGRDTIIKGSWSVAIALLVVVVIVAVYYRFAGVVAALALVLNLLLTVAIMIVIQAQFTLPGLAGLVLTVGMSIDANVLIFERIREETARGAALRMALRNGFDRALSAIIDGNLTTFLTALVLYVIGTDQLRGFGITLMLGNAISMFTAIFCARVIFDAGERTRWLSSLSMSEFFTTPHVDWVKLFIPATVASVVLIGIGLVATVARGTGIFDIDLAGGTTATAMLKKPFLDAQNNVTDQPLRDAIAKQFADIKHPRTGERIEYQVYEISVEGEPHGTVYKIDSSLEDVNELEKHVQQALKDPQTGEDLLRTYQVEYKPLSSAGSADTAPSTAPSGAAPAGKSAPPDASGDIPKTSPEKGSGEKKAASPEGAKECGQEVDAKPDEDAKPAEKAAEKAAEKSTEKSSEAAGKSSPTSPATTAPGAEPTAEPAPITTAVMTEMEIRFPQNKISAYALREHIERAAKAAIGQNPYPIISNPQWDSRDNSAFDTWSVKLALNEENSKKVLAELERTMESSPVWQNTSSVSGQVTRDMQLKALTAVLVSLLGIAAYVWFRFQNLSWGIAAIASLAHDTLVMLAGVGASYYVASWLGFLGIQEFKISLTVVAGFLTLIGYSINDTIVIFDRIREIRGKSTQMTMQMINDAVNQTLSRTILTGGLTLLVVIILYIWGGEGIHTFAFCMLIGVISGTYSTVFIAAPLLLWLMGTRPAAAQATKPTATVKQPVTTGGRT